MYLWKVPAWLRGMQGSMQGGDRVEMRDGGGADRGGEG